MKKIVRKLSTDKNREFWESAIKASAVLESWPTWKRAGINVASVRKEARPVEVLTEPRDVCDSVKPGV